MLATCPHCKAEQAFVAYGEPGSMAAARSMFTLMKPLASAVDDLLDDARKRDSLECTGCQMLSSQCARCKTLFMHTGDLWCPACHSNSTADG